MDVRALLYPLGFFPSLLFTSRFILQWWQSERKKRSHLTRSFWKLSLLGHLIMIVHSTVQVQLHVALIQGINGVIAKRNLELMGGSTRPGPRVLPFLLTTGFITLIFCLQGIICFGGTNWVQTPTLPWADEASTKLGLAWHLVGFVGMLIFASRFWVQWWQTERQGISHLSLSFWWLSIAGASLSLVYFIRLNDPVHIVGYMGGLVPYVRNLMLIYRRPKEA